MIDELVRRTIQEIEKVYYPIGDLSQILPDGKYYRVDKEKTKDKRISVWGRTWDFKGTECGYLKFVDWRIQLVHIVVSWNADKIDKKELKQIKQKLKESELRHEAERKKENKECIDKYEPRFAQSQTPEKTHPYLYGKKIYRYYNSKIDNRGTLIIPVYQVEGYKPHFAGCQLIFKDEDGQGYTKIFPSGTNVKGGFCPFGDIKNSEYIYVAEGFATAASIYEATKTPTLCIFNAGNILLGIKSLRKMNPFCKIIICADRDINQDKRWHDIGNKKAVAATKEIHDCISIRVKFDNEEKSQSDFNDLRCSMDLNAVKDQLIIDRSSFVEVICLGHQKLKSFYFVTDKKEFIDLDASRHTKNNLLWMAPDVYWLNRFKGAKLFNKKNEVDWDVVVQELSREQSNRGYYRVDNERGVGVWGDNGKIQVNQGDKVYDNGKMKSIIDFIHNKDYKFKSNVAEVIDWKKPLTDDESKKIIDAFKLLKYKNPNDYHYVIGWIVMTQIFTAIKFKPHLWLTGEFSAGKSTVIRYIRNLIHFNILRKNLSAPGVRQRIGIDAKVTLFDESESKNTRTGSERMGDILSLARELTDGPSDSSYGQASGEARDGSTNTMFCFGSIEIQQLEPADESRIAIVEMNKITKEIQTKSEFDQIERKMKAIEKFKIPLLVRVVKNYHLFQKNFKTSYSFLRDTGYTSRQSEFLGTFITGFHLMKCTEVISVDDLEHYVDQFDFESSEYMESEKSDSERCLDSIFQIPLDDKKGILVSDAINVIMNSNQKFIVQEFEQQLSGIGIRFFKEKSEIFIQSKHGPLRDKMKRYTNYSDQSRILRRHPAWVANQTIHIAGRKANGNIIKIEVASAPVIVSTQTNDEFDDPTKSMTVQ